MNQLFVAKNSLKIIVNHFNEGLILRNKDNIDYCNEMGLRFIYHVSKNILGDDQEQLNMYMARLRSMDFLTDNIFKRNRNSSRRAFEQQIMNTPMFKLFMSRSNNNAGQNGAGIPLRRAPPLS